jgi:hypothetical protein
VVAVDLVADVPFVERDRSVVGSQVVIDDEREVVVDLEQVVVGWERLLVEEFCLWRWDRSFRSLGQPESMGKVGRMVSVTERRIETLREGEAT